MSCTITSGAPNTSGTRSSRRWYPAWEIGRHGTICMRLPGSHKAASLWKKICRMLRWQICRLILSWSLIRQAKSCLPRQSTSQARAKCRFRSNCIDTSGRNKNFCWTCSRKPRSAECFGWKIGRYFWQPSGFSRAIIRGRVPEYWYFCVKSTKNCCGTWPTSCRRRCKSSPVLKSYPGLNSMTGMDTTLQARLSGRTFLFKI